MGDLTIASLSAAIEDYKMWFRDRKLADPIVDPAIVLVPDPYAGSDDLCRDLVKAKECLMEYWHLHRDPMSNYYKHCEPSPTGEDDHYGPCMWCHEAQVGIAGIDKALHVLRNMK